MSRRHFIASLSVAGIAWLWAGAGAAQDVVKVGLSIPLTGAGFSAVGRQVVAGARLYIAQHGNTVAGKRIELIVRDDGGVADAARRIVQEMIVNDKVAIVGGGITPTALAIGQLVTQAKVATVVMVSGASVTVERSPYMVRTSFTLGQSSAVMASGPLGTAASGW